MSFSKALLKQLVSESFDLVLPIVLDMALATIKNPNSAKAKALKPVLVAFAKAVSAKYPGEVG